MKPFKIKTERLTIRPHVLEDAIILNKALQTSFNEIHNWMDWALKPQTLAETKNYVEFSKTCWASTNPKELPLLIFDAEEKNLLGATGYQDINWLIPRFAIGYWAHSNCTGQGYITEAINALSHVAFEHLHAKRLEICCDIDNQKSAAIPKRLGFTLEAHLQKHRLQNLSQKLSGTLVFVRYDGASLPSLTYQLL